MNISKTERLSNNKNFLYKKLIFKVRVTTLQGVALKDLYHYHLTCNIKNSRVSHLALKINIKQGQYNLRSSNHQTISMNKVLNKNHKMLIHKDFI